ncbi:MAG: hypothetical protein ACQESR_23605 [Planctomycetota bacterium]
MNSREIPIGAKVTFYMAGRPFVGRVSEDRGPIGMGGRHLYLVRYEVGRGNWNSTELPAEEIADIEYRPVNLRGKRAVEYIIPVQALEAHSLFAKPEHAQALANYLRSQGVRVSEDPDAIQGEINILVDKSTPWDTFVALLNDWKRQYAEESAEQIACTGADGRARCRWKAVTACPEAWRSPTAGYHQTESMT